MVMDHTQEGRGFAESQWESFVTDCLVSKVKAATGFTPVWNTYLTYCQAIDQTPALSRQALSKRLQDMFYRRMNRGKAVFGCLIRENLFVREVANEQR